MTLVKVVYKFKESDKARFTLWIHGYDEWRAKDNPYEFYWKSGEVYFLFGGWGANQPRLIGKASTCEEAEQIAKQYKHVE